MKRFVTTILVLLLTVFASDAQRPKVAVVLSGGGAKGAAHVGVLRVLEEYGIPIDMITGTSMGALIGGLYAVGNSVDELDSLLTSQDWTYVISGAAKREEISFEKRSDEAKYLVQVPFGIDWSAALGRKSRQGGDEAEDDEEGDDEEADTPPVGTITSFVHLAPEGQAMGMIPLSLMAGQNIYNLLSDCTVGYHDVCDFNALPIPFACVAVDLVEGSEVVFNKGILPIALRASMAIPGVFAPVKTDNMVLVDGGVKNNFPVDVARQMGADIIIGVRFPSDGAASDYNDLAGMLSRVANVAMSVKTKEEIADTDILIEPAIDGFGMMSFDNASLRTLIDNGEAAARKAAPQLLELRDMLKRKEQEHAEWFVGPMPAPKDANKATKLSDTITLASIKFVGLNENDEAFIKRNFPLKTGEKISIGDIESAANELYATKAYTSVVYSLAGDTSPFDLTMTMVPNRNNRLGLGLRFDTEEVSAILLGIGFNHNRLYGHRLSIDARVANFYHADVNYSYLGRNMTRFDAGYGLRHYAMQVFTDAGSKNTIDYLQNNFTLAVSTGHLRRGELQLGLMGRAYYYRTPLSVPQVPESYSVDISRTAFFGPFLDIDIDHLDNAWFPKRGFKFSGNVSYISELKASDTYSPVLDASLSFKWVGTIGGRFSMSPFVHSRLLVGNDIPVVMSNSIGGNQAGRYNEHQIPFYGTTGTLMMDPMVTVAGLDLRYNVHKSHYVLFSGNYALSGHDFDSFIQSKLLSGYRLGYAFDSIAGPIGFDLNWNSRTRRVGAYLSFGFWF